MSKLNYFNFDFKCTVIKRNGKTNVVLLFELKLKALVKCFSNACDEIMNGRKCL